MKKTRFLLISLGLFIAFGSINAYAGAVSGLDHIVPIKGKMTVTMEEGASLMITQQDGNVLLVENQSDLPENLDPAAVDVFDGCVRVVSDQRTVLFCVSSDRGTVTALSGIFEITTNLGKSVVLNQGDVYHIHPDEGDVAKETEELAPPTAAGGDDLGNSLNSFNPFDSTNIDNRDNPASPSGF